MKTQPRTWPTVLLGTFVLGGTVLGITALGSATNVVAAERTGRSAVAEQQKIRAALAVAMADNTLSRTEVSSILRKAKKVLGPDDYQGLKLSLARVSARQQAARSPTPAKTPEKESAAGAKESAKENNEHSAENSADDSPEGSAEDSAEDRKASEPITQTGALVPREQEPSAEPAAYQEPAEPADQRSPFVEEQDSAAGLEPVPDMATTLADDSLMPSDDYLTSADDCYPMELDDCGEIAAGCGMLAGGFGSMFDCISGSFGYGCPVIRLSTSVEAFKGPLDLDNHNGNFGVQFGANAGFPLYEPLAIGVQAGTSAILADFHGTEFTGSRIRSQNFTTVGLYRNVPVGAKEVRYGFAFDWLTDDYYWNFKMSQWRVKLAYEVSPCSEIGIWACIPNDGDTAMIGDGQQRRFLQQFKPVAQGSLYLNRCWPGGTSTTAWAGIVEEPGDFVFGGAARVPIGDSLSFVGNFNYVLPSASGPLGQDEEMWNVSLGIEFTIGQGRNHCLNDRVGPLFPLANNGTFAIRRF